MASRIAFLSARVSALLDNSRYLLIQFLLPFYDGVEIVGLVWPLLGAQEQYIDDVPEHLFQRLTVSLVHGQQKSRNHDEYHHQCSRAHTDLVSEYKEKRYADERAAGEADELPLGEIEKNFCFDLG